MIATNNFSGDFDISKWTLVKPYGNIITTNVPTSVTLISSNSGVGALTFMTIPIDVSGTITFTYNSSTLDGALVYDPFGYMLNGILTYLNSVNDRTKTGTLSVSVNKNDTFGFFVLSTDGSFGSSTTIISNFKFELRSPILSNFSVSTKTYGDAPFSLTAPSSNSPGSFSYTSSNTSVATISGSTVTIVGAGSTTITATQAATTYYDSKTITATFVVDKASPILSNFSVPTKTYGDASFSLIAPTSNIPGSFSYTSSNISVATISGNTVSIVGAGSTIITATQAGTNNYLTNSVTAPFVVDKALPTLSNFSISTKTYGDASFSLIAPTSNSPGSFSYTSSNISVATISGNTVSIVGAGSTIITATQAGTNNYLTNSVTAPFVVDKALPTLSNFSIPTKTYGSFPFTITAPSTNSDGSFIYTSSNSLVASINGNRINVVGPGTAIITAILAETSNYQSGIISTLFKVNKQNLYDATPIENSAGLQTFITSNGSFANISGNVKFSGKLLPSRLLNKLLFTKSKNSVRISIA